MKATLRYKLPKDNLEYVRATKAEDLAMALWDISQYLRGVDKYDTGDDIGKIRGRFYEILSEYDLNLDNLIE